jgi:hypothetical protein
MSSFFGKIGTKVAQALGTGTPPPPPPLPNAVQGAIFDVAGNRHLLTAELGRGGQGAVFQTSNREIAVKLLLDKNGEPMCADGSEADAELRETIERVLTLPLPSKGIAAPISVLRDKVGYTMRMLVGMQPIHRLLETTGNPSKHYLLTGGLRRRLALLATLADRVAALHAAGLVFTDLSPNNVFISGTTGGNEVWLIDPDNIHYMQQRTLRFYTPRYGAPEIVSGRSGADTLSDCWSFAVIAHEALRMVHPFEGDGAEEVGWDVTASGVQKPGEPPLVWINDPDDISNRTENGLALDAVATKRMYGLFERAFCAGREMAGARPSMQEWSDALWEAHDLAVECSTCKGTSFVRAKEPMACCGAGRPAILRIESRLWVPELDDGLKDLAQSLRAMKELEASLDRLDADREKDQSSAGAIRPQRAPVASMRVAATGSSTVPLDLVCPATADRRREPKLELRVVNGRLVVEVLGDAAGWTWIDGVSSRIQPLKGKFDVQMSAAMPQICHIHCGDESESHRLLSFVYFQGGLIAG